MKRRKLSRKTEADVLHSCRRRCCLCYFLENNRGTRKGQLAHLDHNSANDEMDNIVWLCFEHHDEFDSRTSQSKGFTEEEVRRWRDKLIELYKDSDERPVNTDVDLAIGPTSNIAAPERASAGAWRFPLWQVADLPEFFAYSAKNGAGGVCVIERIDLPDGRIVIACIQAAGNPGPSITNSVEEIYRSVCERFELPMDKLIWLENYDYGDDRWNRVVFAKVTLHAGPENPKWQPMTKDEWANLGLRPLPKLDSSNGQLKSKIEKMFRWPKDDAGFI